MLIRHKLCALCQVRCACEVSHGHISISDGQRILLILYANCMNVSADVIRISVGLANGHPIVHLSCKVSIPILQLIVLIHCDCTSTICDVSNRNTVVKQFYPYLILGRNICSFVCLFVQQFIQSERMLICHHRRTQISTRRT